jgi:predicted nucleotidyltransferase
MISPEKMAEYRRTAEKRRVTAVAKLDQRFAQGREIARELADLLYTDFGAEQVFLFGSLTDRDLFHTRSDIDLAAWGIPEGRYLAAVAAVTSYQTAFSVDLVRLEEASVRLQQTVESKGMAL